MYNSTFFTVGGTVQAGGGEYIHRSVDDELLAVCEKGDFSFVLTARQMGKSSLMVRTAERLAESGTRSVVIDLSQLGVQVSPDAWYLGLLTRVEDALDLDTDAYEWWEAHRHLGLTQRLTQFFQFVLESEVASNVVVFIDEIDSTLSLPFTDDFFAAIRYVYNARSQVAAFNRLTFVLIGVASPKDLISDATRTPFNIGKQVAVEYFTEREAMPLTKGFDLPDRKSKEILGWILEWTGGHPYLTQRLCASAASRGKQDLTRAELDQIVSETFFGQNSSEDSNLRFVQDMVVRRAPDTDAVLTTYERIVRGRRVTDDKASQTLSHLKLSGIVTRENGSLVVSNRIYAEVFDLEWVRDQFPEHWIKRVPPSVKGLVAASFIALIALGLFALQAQRAARAREQNEVQARLNTRLAEEIERSDSLLTETETANLRLGRQFAVTDSLRRQEEAANDQLVDQILLADRLRAQSEALRIEAEDANVQLSTQIEVSDSLRRVTESLLEAARRERIETITIALASHAQRQLRLGDPELGALLARQAFLFSRRGEGQFLAPVHDAMRTSLEALGNGPSLTGILNSSSVRSIAYTPDGRILAWSQENGQITVAKTDQDESILHDLNAHETSVRAVSFSSDPASPLLASGDDAGRVLLWEDVDQTEPRPIELGRHGAAVWTLAFSGDAGKLAAAGGNEKVTIWNTETRRVENTISLEGSLRVRDVTFAPGSDDLVISVETGEVLIYGSNGMKSSWQTGQGRLLALAASPDGQRLATGGSSSDIKIWDLDDRSTQQPITLHGHEGPINSLAFSPDGQRLASGSADHSIQVWDLAHPTQSPILIQGHEAWVWSVDFRPDGVMLASAGADKRMSTWFVDLETMAERICRSVSRDLTSDEWVRFVGVDVPFQENIEPCLTTALRDAAGSRTGKR